MKSHSIYEIIQHSLDILEEEVKLSKASLKAVASHSFKLISDFFRKT